MTREEAVKAFKKAVENKRDALKRTEERWIQEGIQGKLSLLPDSAKYKLSQTITKMVNKGSNNLIAIVL